MRRPLFAENPSYRGYEDGLRKLHRLIAQGAGDTDEAAALRREMDVLGRKLTREERDRLRGLSSDLQLLHGAETNERFDGTQEELRRALQDAWAGRHWETLLALLRRGPGFLSAEAVAFFRFSAYDALGHHDTALLFLRHADQRNAEPPGYKAMLLNQLLRMGRFDEAVAQAEAVIEEVSTPPHVLVNAAYALFRTAGKMPEEEARPVHSRIVAVLERALRATEPSSRLTSTLIAGAYLLLGSSYEALEDPANARAAYDQALERKPDYAEVWTARGLLRLDSDPAGALSDFEQAAVHGARSLLPYVHLARHHLSEGRYERSLEYSLGILDRTGDPRIRALALRWIATAYSELHRPDDTVRETSPAGSYGAASGVPRLDIAAEDLDRARREDRERVLEGLSCLVPKQQPSEARLLALLLPGTRPPRTA